MESIMIDVKQLSEYLNISISLVRKLVRKSEIPYNKVGAKILFPKSGIDIWLKNNQKGNEYERRNY